MSMPISKLITRTGLLGGIIVLGGCGTPDNDTLAAVEAEAAKKAANDGKLECALNGEQRFSRNCTSDRLKNGDAVVLTIRHPDGGFRRFNVLTDGRGLTSADGSDEAKISITGDDRIMVTVADDRYLMPAKVKSQATAQTIEATETTAEN